MAVLLQYAVTASVLTPTTVLSGVTGGTITNGLLTSLTAGTAGYASDPVFAAAPASASTSQATALSSDSYFFFSITPTSGNTISLTSLTMNASRGGAATPRGYDVRSSVDSYAATLGTANLNTQRTSWTGVSIDLSGASFQNLTSSVTFRVYVWCPSTANVIDFDDVIINGSVTTGGAGTVEQEGYRWRNDDGTETTATWLAAQDTDIIEEKETNVRLRVLLNSTLDRGTENYQLEFRPVGGTTWTVIE